jgi:hypothetical protein
VNPSSFGQKITFTAKVTPQFGGTATGNVVFKDGTTTVGAGAISGGQATLSVSLLHPGNHSITATYAGNGSLVGSTSPGLTQVVHKANTKTTLTSAPNPSTSGHAVTFTATPAGMLPSRPRNSPWARIRCPQYMVEIQTSTPAPQLLTTKS